ncbi:translation initiation factor IF-2 [Radicibacter daui]|uniref:translation initiation factor IF-2 n=1 Tax=Radicibacter daui TaxID=3064829 RepID=UPI004046BBFD
MTERNDQDSEKKTLSLSSKGKQQLRQGGDANQVRQSFSHGRSKAVTVEVKRKRTVEKVVAGAARTGAKTLSDEERESRLRALRVAKAAEETRAQQASEQQAEAAAEAAAAAAAPVAAPAPAPRAPLDAAARRKLEEEERKEIEQEEAQRRQRETQRLSELEAERKREQEARNRASEDRRPTGAASDAGTDSPRTTTTTDADGEFRRPVVGARARDDDDEGSRRGGTPGRGAPKGPAKAAPTRGRNDNRRDRSKLTVSEALSTGDGDSVRTRSLAAFRRAREKERRKESSANREKIVREVQIPDTITVQELANRMAERAGEVIKTLMRSGIMATINQSIDADTAELIVTEFGHTPKRVSESDVELVLDTGKDAAEDMLPRPPVVTIMGHVDHGKTSLLDALRSTDVAAREAGGITQHIGAYQIQLESGSRITFIDTPGHAAFTSMRARGANVTDIVVLVVAANDSVMPQTVEAIAHAKAAGVPMIVAVNKIDLPGADKNRVLTDLLQYGIVTEEMGGDVLAVPVSAKTKQGLDKLEEAILLQSEILELRANPNRLAEGSVIEAKLERGRGSVATVLIERGTLKVGDSFVVGAEFGRARALLNDRAEQIREAGPGFPVEVVGLNGTPQAGDRLVVVEDESEARRIAEYRQAKVREQAATASARGSLEQMFNAIREGEAKNFPVVIKGDVQGSIEAINASLQKLTEDNKEVRVQVLHSGVGAITESDITLAAASKAMVIGFNVRANPQAREMAKRDGVEIRYYSIIYNVIDEVKAALSGMLSPEVTEEFIGYASIRQVFNITKVGKVAGCMITEGVVKRGAGCRLLRDNVVIHEGTLKTLKRFKDEVREVREGFECGMAFENYDDIREGDVVECFEIKETARVL